MKLGQIRSKDFGLVGTSSGLLNGGSDAQYMLRAIYENGFMVACTVHTQSHTSS